VVKPDQPVGQVPLDARDHLDRGEDLETLDPQDKEEMLDPLDLLDRLAQQANLGPLVEPDHLDLQVHRDKLVDLVRRDNQALLEQQVVLVLLVKEEAPVMWDHRVQQEREEIPELVVIQDSRDNRVNKDLLVQLA